MTPLLKFLSTKKVQVLKCTEVKMSKKYLFFAINETINGKITVKSNQL